MTIDEFSGFQQLPNEIIEQILDYIQPFSCQIKLMPIPVFKPFIINKIYHRKKWIISSSSMKPIIINKIFNNDNDDDNDNYNLMPVGYIPPVVIRRNFKNIRNFEETNDNGDEFYIQNIGSLIHQIEKFPGYYPKNLIFQSFECFKLCLSINPLIINNAKEISVRIAKLIKGNSIKGDRYWNQVEELINLNCNNLTRLELQYIDLTNLKLNNLLSLKNLKYSGQINNLNQLNLNNLKILELTDIIINDHDNYLNLLPSNLQSLKIEKIKISNQILKITFNNLYEFSAGFELNDENSIIDLSKNILLNKLSILGCNQLISLNQLKLPISIQELFIENCFYLWEINSINQYINLKSFSWNQALLSLDFYQSTNFPDSLINLIINGQDSKTDLIINDLIRILPNKFDIIYGINCFKIDEEFKIPKNLINLSISNCRYLIINCSKIILPNGLKSLILSNLANLLNIDEFKFPNSLVNLNLSSNKIKSIKNLKIPKNLRILKLDDNRLEQIPKSFELKNKNNKLTQITLTDDLLT